MISTKEIKIRNRQELHPQGLKMCHRCHQVKPRTDEFFTVACRKNHPRRDRHKGYCKECDKKRRRLQKLALKKDPERHLRRLIASLRSRAKTQSLPFNLTGDDLVMQYHQQNGNCYWTGRKFDLTSEYHDRSRPANYSMSVDKLTPSMGYVKGNVVLCLWKVNQLKNNLTAEEFIEFCSLITKRFSK